MIYQGDCLEIMRDVIKDKTIDLILTDLPYGVTQNKWDNEIDLNKLFSEYNRIIKDDGIICLFGIEPFSSKLRFANLKNYKYDWSWVKDKATGHLNSKKRPMRNVENISIFYKKPGIYNPQYHKKEIKNIRPAFIKSRGQSENYGKCDKVAEREIDITLGYPLQTLYFNTNSKGKGQSLHPTQKPVELLEYLIKTYTNEGGRVLDSCMGSGTTGIACLNTNRNFEGIELDENYFSIAKKRIWEH